MEVAICPTLKKLQDNKIKPKLNSPAICNTAWTCGASGPCWIFLERLLKTGQQSKVRFVFSPSPPSFPPSPSDNVMAQQPCGLWRDSEGNRVELRSRGAPSHLRSHHIRVFVFKTPFTQENKLLHLSHFYFCFLLHTTEPYSEAGSNKPVILSKHFINKLYSIGKVIKISDTLTYITE